MATKAKPAATKDTKAEEITKEAEVTRSPAEEAAVVALGDVKRHVTLIKKGVHSQEPRHLSRVIRTIPRLRKRLTAGILWQAITEHMSPADASKRQALQAYLPAAAASDPVVKAALIPLPETKKDEKKEEKKDEADDAMDVDKPADAKPKPLIYQKEIKKKETPYVVEIELYVTLLVLVYLLDDKQIPQAVKLSQEFLDTCRNNQQRTSNPFAARAYFYFARARELEGSDSDVRSVLLDGLRTATLRTDEVGQATILNLLLRSLVQNNLIEQARLLVSKTKFPESASNNEQARYLYYLGWITAIQLDYSEADRHLTQATRKAPSSAVGFLQTATKLLIAVKLLLGEIPDRDMFRKPNLRRSLIPLFQLTQAVRVGDLKKFSAVVEQFADGFRKDKIYTLILRHNVIKTGVRMINLSYSRISLADIANKLQLDSAEDAEFIVAKAIRDGVIDANIDHQEGYIRSKDMTDVYSTTEPQEAFHKRIQFCLKLYNDSVKAMRFPPNAYRKYLETPEQRREREMQEEIELQEEMDDDA